MLGYESAEDLMQDGSRDDLLNASQRQQLLEESERDDRINSIDAVWRRKDGKRITVRLSGRAVRGSEGNVSSFELFAEDVTQRLALEEQLRHSQKMEAVGRMARQYRSRFQQSDCGDLRSNGTFARYGRSK
jgi:PAS domain S-box-containing protein